MCLVWQNKGIWIDGGHFLGKNEPFSAPSIWIDGGHLLGKNEALSAPRCVWFGKIKVFG